MRRTVGEIARIQAADRGLPKRAAKGADKPHSRRVPMPPTPAKRARATRKTRPVSRALPSASKAAISTDMATGSPAVEMTQNRAYSS